MSAYFGTLYYRTLPSYEWAKKGMEDRILEALSDPYDPLKDPSRKKSLVELHTKLGLATDDDTLRKYLYSFRLKSAKITVPKIAWLKLQGQASDLANHIRNMHWTVKHAQKANLPIPDSAMVHFRQLGRQTVIGINASVEPGSFFTIPISSNSLIEFGPAKELRTIQMQVSATDFSVQRRQLVGAAKRFVFVKRQCADIEKWARELPKIEVPNAAKVPNPNQPKLNFGWK